ncbi:MAG: RNA-binding protein [Candidatus Protochlamydia sp.]|nr:RNA-binding protein [Candidatus Protochlamydia sp.]
MKKIFVGNLSWKTSEDNLKAHFEAFGKVVSAKIVTDQMTGKSKGFGFVEMESASDAETAIRELNGKPLGDRNLRVSLAQERERTERREPRSFGGGERSSFGERRNYRSN